MNISHALLFNMNTFGYPYNLEISKDTNREWLAANYSMYKFMSESNDPIEILIEIIIRIRVGLIAYRGMDYGHARWLHKRWSDLCKHSTPEVWKNYRKMRSVYSDMFIYFNSLNFPQNIDYNNSNVGHIIVDTVFPVSHKFGKNVDDPVYHTINDIKKISKYIICADLHMRNIHTFKWLCNTSNFGSHSSEYPVYVSNKQNLDYNSMTSWDDMIHPHGITIDEDIAI